MTRRAPVDFLCGVHQLSDRFALALYTSAATLNANTRAYTPMGEVSGPGYTAGGQYLRGVRVVPLGETGAGLLFDSAVWQPVTVTARAALIYNASRSGAAITVLDFGEDVKAINGKFLVPLSGVPVVVFDGATS